MKLQGNKLTGQVIQPVTDLYKAISEEVETLLQGQWRITQITMESTAQYGATLKTRTADHPDYILGSVVATFKIEANEDGPLDRDIDGSLVAIPKKQWMCQLHLLHSGELMITDIKIMMPTSLLPEGMF